MRWRVAWKFRFFSGESVNATLSISAPIIWTLDCAAFARWGGKPSAEDMKGCIRFHRQVPFIARRKEWSRWMWYFVIECNFHEPLFKIVNRNAACFSTCQINSKRYRIHRSLRGRSWKNPADGSSTQWGWPFAFLITPSWVLFKLERRSRSTIRSFRLFKFNFYIVMQLCSLV